MAGEGRNVGVGGGGRVMAWSVLLGMTLNCGVYCCGLE